MKRSQINAIIKEVAEIFDKHNFKLPAWAMSTPEEWKTLTASGDCTEIIEHQLGWDITDFGKGDFLKEGLSLFTVRNGKPGGTSSGKTYCEKLMLSFVGQETPMHFHWNKMEDIINRAGGILVIELWKAAEDETLSDEPFTVQVDGITRHLRAGEKVRLSPGESITLEPYIYHCFWAEGEPCVIGEVSKVNDDSGDNRFLAPLGRFPEIIEDESKAHLLCNEYPVAG